METHPTWQTEHAPALATQGNLMWIFMLGTDGLLYASATDNSSWTAGQVIGGAKPMDSPAAVSHDNKLYVMYRR